MSSNRFNDKIKMLFFFFKFKIKCLNRNLGGSKHMFEYLKRSKANGFLDLNDKNM